MKQFGSDSVWLQPYHTWTGTTMFRLKYPWMYSFCVNEIRVTYLHIYLSPHFSIFLLWSDNLIGCWLNVPCHKTAVMSSIRLKMRICFFLYYEIATKFNATSYFPLNRRLAENTKVALCSCQFVLLSVKWI